MRRLVRKMIKKEAERNGVKSSKYVADIWERLQVEKQGGKKQKLGITCRLINKAKGTHKKKTWGNRIAAELN